MISIPRDVTESEKAVRGFLLIKRRGSHFFFSVPVLSELSALQEGAKRTNKWYEQSYNEKKTKAARNKCRAGMGMSINRHEHRPCLKKKDQRD